MGAQSHRSDPRTLGRRTLQRDHRSLAAMLKPGMFVLDVGCGTGAITAGIATAVGPDGRAVGLDRDEGLLDLARNAHAGIANVLFETGDATNLRYSAEFDIVTGARILQWIATPEKAVQSMKRATKPGGAVLVLDYSHLHNAWEPEPPREFRRFYEAFLAWRQANDWDNEIAHHLPDLFAGAGMIEIHGRGAIGSRVEDEVADRGDADFEERTALWSEVIENVGCTIAEAGFCTKQQVAIARECYAPWAKTTLTKQTLVMRAVSARVP
jgi:SAM-dependent methyltransferase